MPKAQFKGTQQPTEFRSHETEISPLKHKPSKSKRNPQPGMPESFRDHLSQNHHNHEYYAHESHTHRYDAQGQSTHDYLTHEYQSYGYPFPAPEFHSPYPDLTNNINILPTKEYPYPRTLDIPSPLEPLRQPNHQALNRPWPHNPLSHLSGYLQTTLGTESEACTSMSSWYSERHFDGPYHAIETVVEGYVTRQEWCSLAGVDGGGNSGSVKARKGSCKQRRR